MNKILKRQSVFLLKIIIFVIIGFLLFLETEKESKSLLGSKTILRKVRKATLFLKKNQNLNGAICEKKYKEFDVWETINAVIALSLWKDKINYDIDSVIKNALNFLKSSENQNGMVSHNSKDRATYCLETSSEYIRLLTMLNKKLDAVTGKKLSFLKKQQLPSGRWKIVSPVIPAKLQEFPSVTAFALRAFLYANQKSKYGSQSLRFLSSSQRTQGDWGVEWEYYGTPFYAMEPVLYVLSVNNKRHKFDRTIQKAKNYLITHQNSNGYWFYKLKGFNNLPSAELQTALALQCCFHCGFKSNDKIILKGINWLLRKQRRNGCWFGGYFPHPNSRTQKREDIYATSQVLIMLYRHLYFYPGRATTP